MKRREFLNTAAAASGAFSWRDRTSVRAERRRRQVPGAQGATPPTPKMTFKTRPAKVEILFKAPGLSGNGMQVNDEGIWTIDIAGSRGDTPGRCKVYLSSFDGKLVRELAPEGTGPSGLGHDGKSIWIGSTYSREIIRADAKTGETMEKHFTPGAGVIYRRTTDIAARPDTYGPEGARRSRQSARGGAVPAAATAVVAAAAAEPSRQARTPGRARVTVLVSDVAGRSPAIPDPRHPVPARTAFKRRTASCGSPCRPAA